MTVEVEVRSAQANWFMGENTHTQVNDRDADITLKYSVLYGLK